jgi:two-component system cell cycle sensor histidine kinase/response regulator CckA
MDMMMPNLDGAATIKRLQTINPEVKVIVTTGLLDHQTKALLSDDIKICLPKPYTLKQILIALREIIGS